MKTYSGDVEVVVKMRYSVVGLEIGGEPTKEKVLEALRDQAYNDIIDTEELEILIVETLDLAASEDDGDA